MKQIIKSLLAGAAALSITACKEAKKEVPQQPNILFIMADDHTSQAWGLYGGVLKDYVQNDNIERLANEGALLNNCLVSNSICVPSRATILSGQYSHNSGVKILADAMPREKNNIAKVLKNSGYQTAVIGKWHLKTEPSGFDYYKVLPGQGVYHNPKLKDSTNWVDGYAGGVEHKGYSSDIISQLTMDWIDQRDDSKPFMAMCHFKATHEPFDYPERFKDLYKDEVIPAPETLMDQGAESTGRTFKGHSLDVLTQRYEKASRADVDEKDKFMPYPGLPFTTEGLAADEARNKTYQKFVKDFMRCGAAIDDNIGKLLDYLDEKGLAENTIVIYTADNGYFLGEHGFFDKRMVYEEAIKMPFVIRYPNEIPAGTVNNDIIENVDFSALMADYAGVDYPEEMEGRSFRRNLLNDTPEDWRKYGYYRYWQHSATRPAHFGIRGERYKLAFFYGDGKEKAEGEKYWEFYDLQEDPQEVYNAYSDTRYDDIITELKIELKQQRNNLGDEDMDNPELRKLIEAHWN